MKNASGAEQRTLGVGVGLRSPHYSHILSHLLPGGQNSSTPAGGEPSSISWFEAISENYMGMESGNGGNPLAVLEKIRVQFPIVLHGVSLSIGSADDLNFAYLEKLRTLIEQIEPAWVSDHVCWTGVNGENLHDLLPLPYTEEVLRHLTDKIHRAQDFLKRRLVFENVSAYLSYRHSEMTEWDFLSELHQRTGCGLLLDINNIYVSSVNQNFDPVTFINAIPGSAIEQIHLAGHSQSGECLIDTHDGPVSDRVWDLYSLAVERFGQIPTLIEWDDRIPEFSVLEAEVARAQEKLNRRLILQLNRRQQENHAKLSRKSTDLA